LYLLPLGPFIFATTIQDPPQGRHITTDVLGLFGIAIHADTTDTTTTVGLVVNKQNISSFVDYLYNKGAYR